MTTLFASSALLMGSSVSAVTLDSSFNVKLAIASLCIVETINDVDFGLVDGSMPTQTKTTELQIKCNKDQPYTVALQPSNNDKTGKGAMKGSNKKETIAYSLYSDAARTKLWGSEDTNLVNQTATGAIQKFPLYVMVDGAEFDKSADSYNDVVAVTVTY